MFDLEIHSPLTRIRGFDLEKYGVHVWVKRDDLIHPFISGNKWRKLKYALSEAKMRGKDQLVTFGGAWSNHLLATACAGATFGFRTRGFVRGDEAVSNPVLSLCSLFGMDLQFVDREQYRDKLSLFESHLSHHSDGASAYFIDEGGYGSHAVTGCAEIIGELLPQAKEVSRDDRDNHTLLRYHIFCACGTGATLAGLSTGIQEISTSNAEGMLDQDIADPTIILHGVPVLKNADFVQRQIFQLHPQAKFEWHDHYHFGGYAKSNSELDGFVRDFCSGTGVLIEPVYTGKLFYAVFDLIRQGYFTEGDRLFILHSGGLTGILGAHERFAITGNN